MIRFFTYLRIVLAALVLAAPAVHAGGGASPVTTGAFALPQAGYRYAFPRDHGAHPRFATEWWYVTGHLAPRGKPDAPPLGFQVTFFRVSTGASPVSTLTGPWALPDLYLAHFALVDAGAFSHAERLARPGPGWSRTDDLDVGCDGWTLKRVPAAAGRPESWRVEAADGFGSLALTLTPAKPPTIHGEDGVHRKGDCPACASHYVSLTRLTASGTVVRGGLAQEMEGAAWFDHEFMSGGLDRGQQGWDWMGLHLSDGSDLMIARLRGTRERADGTLVDPSRPSPTRLPVGAVTLGARGIWTSPTSGARYPVRTTIAIPSEDLTLQLEPVRDDQELDTPGSTGVTYWEGLMRGRGTRGGKPITAVGYLEMTGYAGPAPLTPQGPGGGRP